jgi:hypothetical protein
MNNPSQHEQWLRKFLEPYQGIAGMVHVFQDGELCSWRVWPAAKAVNAQAAMAIPVPNAVRDVEFVVGIAFLTSVSLRKSNWIS